MADKDTATKDPAPEAEKKPKKGAPAGQPKTPPLAKEIGGPKGPEPTRYGDWEKNGIVSDF